MLFFVYFWLLLFLLICGIFLPVYFYGIGKYLAWMSEGIQKCIKLDRPTMSTIKLKIWKVGEYNKDRKGSGFMW